MKNLIQNIPADLQPGDILLYNSHDLMDAVVRWKEGDPDTAHIEIYFGNLLSAASRNNIGVNTYQLRTSGLVHVRRPTNKFTLEYAMPWFSQVKGAPYGWSDIEANAGLVKEPMDAWTDAAVLFRAGMDCSHFASLFLWKGFAAQFDMTYDQRRITPAHFKLSVASQEVWRVAP